jgi:hypothetical protein
VEWWLEGAKYTGEVVMVMETKYTDVVIMGTDQLLKWWL